MISLLVVGFVAGWIPHKIMKRDHGLLTRLFVGVLGSLVSGLVARSLGIVATGFLGEIILASVGAALVLWYYEQLGNKQD